MGPGLIALMMAGTGAGAGAGSGFGKAETREFEEASVATSVEMRREAVVDDGNNMVGNE